MARSELDQPTFAPSRLQNRVIAENYIFVGGEWVRDPGGGGGGGVGITDTDDNAVAAGQTTLLAIEENYIFNGTDWMRLYGGVDNAVAPAGPQQGAYIGGNVNAGLPAYTAGDFSVLNFDTSGRVLVSASISMVTDTDDNAIASGQVLDLIINENYMFNGTDWIRVQGGVDNAAAPASPQGQFTANVAITSFPGFTDGDVAIPRANDEGATITIPRTQEPFEVALSQATIAASATFTSTVVQQNDFFVDSLGRTLLHGFVNYAGTASSATVSVDISVDGGGTFITTDTFTVLGGTPTVIRNLSVALGNRVRVRVTNNDGANTTGTTNIYFALTHAN
jgi:hypothetical protein